MEDESVQKSKLHFDVKNLVGARQGVTSDKITERKKNATLLLELLDRSHVLDFINNNSQPSNAGDKSGGGSKGNPGGGRTSRDMVTWMSLFQSVKTFVGKEIDAVQKLEDKGSTTTGTKKKDITGVFLAYVRACNKKGPNLPLGEVLEFMMTMMKNRKTQSWAVVDHTHILLTHILPVAHYSISISSSKWEELLNLYINLYDSVSSEQKPLIAKAMSSLLLHYSPQADVCLNKGYIFFFNALKNISEEKDCKLLEELLSGLCKYCTIAGPNGRSRICSLGEDILPSVLHLRARGVPTLKSKITEFLRIQVRVHHPGGRILEDNGAWFRDEFQWHNGLEKLYEQIIGEYESGSSSRLRRSTGLTESTMVQGFPYLDLSCDVIYLYLHMLDGRSSTSSSSTGTPRAKKQRRQSCWETLRQGLCSSKDTTATTSWLQLISWLLSKWDNSLPSSEHLSVLSILQSLLRDRETKRADCTKWVLLCLYSLAMNRTSGVQHTSMELKNPTREYWSKVWKSAIKLLAVQCCGSECYLVLTALLQCRLLEPHIPGPWLLLHSSLQQPIRASVAFLACFLSNHSLPHAAASVGGAHIAASLPSTVGGDDSDSVARTSYPLRSQLLHYLLPTSRSEVSGSNVVGGLEALDIGRSLDAACCRVEQDVSSMVVLMSHVLVSLTQRSHGCARLTSLNSFYQYSRPSYLFRELLDPLFTPTHRTRFNCMPFSSLPPPSSKGDLIAEWETTEKIYLQSTFDEPLAIPWLDKRTTQENTPQFSSETTIGCLQTLLLHLLNERSNFLLQNRDSELSSSREHMQQIGSLCELQAVHSSIILHVVLLLCTCEAFTNSDQLRKTPAIKSLPKLLKAIETSLHDQIWNEVEHPYYFRTCGRVLSSLSPFLSFPYLHSSLSPSIRRKVLMVRKLCSLSLPESLQQLSLELAVGKWPVMKSLASSNTFSLAGSSASTFRVRAERRSMSVDFDDENMQGLPDSIGSMQSDYSGSSGAGQLLLEVVLCMVAFLPGPHSVLSLSSLSDKSFCQLCAALFLAHVYINHSLVQPVESDNDEVAEKPEGTSGHGTALTKFEITSALYKCMSEQEKSKPISLQMAYKMIETICLQLQTIKNTMLDYMIEVIGEILALHRKNQTIYGETLTLLTLLLPHLGSSDSDLVDIRVNYMVLASGFWKLYEDKLLPSAVRLKLVDVMASLYAVDMDGSWTSLRQRKRKGQPEPPPISVRQVLIMMVNDVDHAVRMRIGEAITSLYVSKLPLGDWAVAESMSLALLDRKKQEETFHHVMKSLQLAHFISDGLHELSSEDESVNRVSSRIYTLQLAACVSPVCERKIVSELVLAVRRGHIEADLVDKSLGEVAVYLGYGGTKQLLESMLLALVQDWLAEKFSIMEFPFSLMGYSMIQTFLEVYSGLLLPHLVFQTDEASVIAISEAVGRTIPSLLKECLPTCMVLTLTCYAQEESRDQGNRSHDLLQKYISKEDIGQTLQQSMDQFVLELLVRLFEPHTEESHLAQFTLSSDPVPTSSFYASRVVRATLDYMRTCYGTSVTPFVKLLSKRSDHIQSILLSLAVKIETSHRSFEKRRLLVAYNLFVQLISKELRTGGLESIRSFVIMDVVFAVIRIISKAKKTENGISVPLPVELFLVCMDILQTLCLAVLDGCPHELTNHLHVVVANLIPIARLVHTAQGKQALSFLNNVFDRVPPADLYKLDPFPSSDPFVHLKQKQLQVSKEVSLSEKIETFLSGKAGLLDSASEGLVSLQNCLQESQFEIEHILQQGSNNWILKLLCALIDLCPPTLSSVVESCVAQVLGVIGPRDMVCIALPPIKDQCLLDPESLSSEWDKTKIQYVKLLHHLSMLLQDKDVEVVQACGHCLRELLLGKTMPVILAKLEQDEEVDSMYWIHYIHPFKPQKRKTASPLCTSSLPNLASFTTVVDVPNLWLPTKGIDSETGNSFHSRWLTNLVMTLLDSTGVTDEVLIAFKPVCKVKVDLCEEIFPLIIHNILQASKSENNFSLIISRQVRQFFHTVCMEPRPSSPLLTPSQSFKGGQVPSDSIKSMLNMVLYLRTVDRPRHEHGNTQGTPWENNFWLDLDFLDVARAAQRCSAYFTSLLYVEIWRGAREEDKPTLRRLVDPDSCNEEILEADSIARRSPIDEAAELQALLLEAYRHIGEPDSLYGASSSITNPCNPSSTSGSHTTRLSLYEHEGDWHKSLSTHNILMELPGASDHVRVAESLHQLGLSHVLNMYLRGVKHMIGETGNTGGDEVSEYLYETAWRCCQWTQDSQPDSIGSESKGYHQSVFSCLTSIRDGEMTSLQESLKEARHVVMETLVSTGLESTYSLYPFLSKLLCLLEIEELSSDRVPASDHTQAFSNLNFFKKWEKRLLHINSDFQFVEPVLTLRASLLHCLLHVGRQDTEPLSKEKWELINGITKALKEVLFTLSRRARQAMNFQVCERALFSLKMLQAQQQPCPMGPSSLSLSSSQTSNILAMEDAKLHWERGERTYAMVLLKKLLDNLVSVDDKSTLYPTCLNLYGNWLAESYSESPSVILNDYLERSVYLTEEYHVSDKNSVMDAYLSLARFADGQYRRIERHMVSSAFEAKKHLLRKSKVELQNLESTMTFEERQKNKHVRTLQKQSEEDELVVANLLEEKQMFLKKALKNYIFCLQTGGAHDLRIFRLCGLWFANSSDTSINQIMKEGISKLQSYKFIPLMYQLAARICSSFNEDAFQQALQEVIFRCTLEHPYHCFYVVLALGNASKDNLYPKTGYVTGTRNASTTAASKLHRKTMSTSSIDEDKVKAARGIIARLRAKRASLVRSMEQLCDAYIDVAYYDVAVHKNTRTGIQFPRTCPLLHLEGQVAIPTVDLPVDMAFKYENVTLLRSFDSCFQLAGGVNLPKIVTCIGTDGKRRKQLIKGRDDLRQDAVMQQIFVLVNHLLNHDPVTRKRKLGIRTYKVIPLSQRSGVVEWCEGTCPLGEYLVGNVKQPQFGAHVRYRPVDWTALKCRRRMMDIPRGSSKYMSYLEVTKKFQPVFHHFFMEYFPTPPQWFERRLSYTRSVAASSIVGYMVGLGDRHVQNILIDTNTAEFIHIDLGVAFEQGKSLPTPETVPFRLTRDVIDGMGVAGVEGVFRQCCEKTMSLLRAHQEELRTIVEVLLHDPLYQWTLSPHKALNLQRRPEHCEDTSVINAGDIFDTAHTTTSRGQNSDLNKMAERVLIRLQEKLEGIEDGVPLSVSGQVNHLIQEATDPNNLCMLFPGWQPWI